MVRIITLEGSDYSGKTATHALLAKRFQQNKKTYFNTGPIYPTELTARLISLANQATDLDREFLYTMAFSMDSIEWARKGRNDDRVVFQDRYWPSTIAYGRFLNKDSSLHNHVNFKGTFLPPEVVILLSCTPEEKIRRSAIRDRKSVLDSYLLGNTAAIKELEQEIEKSLEGIQRVYRIDTSDLSIDNVANEILSFSSSLGMV